MKNKKFIHLLWVFGWMFCMLQGMNDEKVLVTSDTCRELFRNHSENKVLEFFLELDTPLNLEQTELEAHTSLLFCACQAECFEVAHWLITRGASLNKGFIDDTSLSAIQHMISGLMVYYIHANQYEKLEKLLKFLDRCGNNFLYELLNKQHKKSDLSIDFYCLCFFDDDDKFSNKVCNTIVKHFSKYDGVTALSLALYYGNSTMIQLLLDYGASMPLEESEFQSLLSESINLNKYDLFKILLWNGIYKTYKTESCVFMRLDRWEEYEPEGVAKYEHLIALSKINTYAKNNNFNGLYKEFFADHFDMQSFAFITALFSMKSSKQFDMLEQSFEKNLNARFDSNQKIELRNNLYQTISPAVLQHLLDINVYEWHDTMFEKFISVRKKADMMKYKFKNSSLELLHDYYDLALNYV